jgi:predicted ATPase
MYRDPRELDSRGANVPNAIFRLIKGERREGQVRAEIANRLSRLIEDVVDVRVSEDDRFETRTLALRGKDGVFHPAHSLSDGTLRFLVLTVLDLDPETKGLICLEEPENGIHPERMEAIVQLLRDIAIDPNSAVDQNNPLRQVVINTHSPLVVKYIPIDDLVYLDQERFRANGSAGSVASVFVPPGTWRAENADKPARLVPGKMISYLGRGRPSENEQYVFDWLIEKAGSE